MARFALAIALFVAVSANEHDSARQKIVDFVNEKKTSWKAGIHDRFRGMSQEAFKRTLGVKATSKENLKKIAKPYVKKGLAIPDSFDSVSHWPRCAKVIADIRDQSNCGCCWAFAAAEAASARLCIATNATIQLPLSAEDLCFCGSEDGCSGGELGEAWSYVQETGIVTGGQYNGTGPFGSGFCSAYSLAHCHHHGPQGNDPYPPEGSAGCPSYSSPACPAKCDATAVAPHTKFARDKVTFSGQVETYSDEQSIQESLMQYGPVETAFDVYADFANYVSGVYQHTTGDFLGGHAVLIVGWGVDQASGLKYWKVANSWNPYWGENGYFRIVRGKDECGFEDGAAANSGDSKWNVPFHFQ